MSTLEIAGIVAVCLLLIALLVFLAMLRDKGDGEATIPDGIGSIDEPRCQLEN